MARKVLYIDGVSTGTYGIYINSDTYLNAPAIDYTEYTVPGRDGALVQYNKRLNNVIRKFNCFIEKSAEANFQAFKERLYRSIGYVQLASDYDPTFTQYGYLVDGLEAVPFRASSSDAEVTFDLYFSCKPQKFYSISPTEYSSSALHNYVEGIIPRSHPIIQKLIADIFVGDIPQDTAFVLYNANGSDNTAAVTALSASVSGYAGFIAAIFAKRRYGAQTGITYDSLITYSTAGSISDSASHSPSGAADVFIVVPVSTTGTLSSNVTRGSAYSRSVSLGPSMAFNHEGDYKVFGLQYLMYTAANVEYLNTNILYAIYVRGLIAQTNEVTFEGLIQVDGDAMNDLFTNGGHTTIDLDYLQLYSDTAKAEAKPQNEAKRNANEFVGIYGSIDGRANKFEVYEYDSVLASFHPGTVYVSPTWWTV